MTRINVSVPPIILDDWRLIAEINEIPRVLKVYNNRIEKGVNFSDIPKKFTLGKGHVLFFLNKLDYIENRFNSLLEEFNTRFNVEWEHDQNKIQEGINSWEYYKSLIKTSPVSIEYNPTNYDKQLIVTRIIESIEEKNKDTWYYGKKEPKEIAIKRLKKVAEPLIEKQTKLF